MHPYHGHREHHVGKRRVHHLMKSGGHAHAHHSDEAEDKKLIHKEIKKALVRHEQHEKIEGRKAKHRFARGGKVKKGKGEGHQTNIAIVTPHPRSAIQPGAGPQPGAAAPLVSPAAAPAPPVTVSPAAAPALPMGGLPLRARGGKVIAGEATRENIKKWDKRSKSNSYARGGRMTAGAQSGVGRLEQAEMVKRKK